MTGRWLLSVLAYMCIYICSAFYLANADMFWPVNITDWEKCDKSDNAFRTLYGISVGSCVKECNLRTSCKAVNFIRNRKQCELLRTDLHTDIDHDKRDCVYIKNSDAISDEVVRNCSCQEGQTCVLPEGNCVYKECEKLNVSHGVVKGNMVNVGATIKVVPDIGYTLGSQSPKSVCTSNGTWGNVPVPEPVDCGFPGKVANSTITDGNTVYGSNRTYYCANGYYLTEATTDMTVTCNANGSWSAVWFVCGDNPCSDGQHYVQTTGECKNVDLTVARQKDEDPNDYCSRVSQVDDEKWDAGWIYPSVCWLFYHKLGEEQGNEEKCAKVYFLLGTDICCNESKGAICRKSYLWG